jgi:hypothetical protein
VLCPNRNDWYKYERRIQQLSETVTTVWKRDAIIVMEVMNAKLGPHNETCHKVSWVWPNYITESQIDHIAISIIFRSVLNMRNKRGADIGSDHHLMVTNCRFKILAKEDWKKKKEI